MLYHRPDRYVTVGGVRTRYWIVGDQGSPVVLVHGLSGFVENWDRNLESLAQRHRVWAMDLPGCGLTDKPNKPYTLAYLAQFVNDFMQSQTIERAHVVGSSLGGAVALTLAGAFPKRVSRLVLVDSAGLGQHGAMTLRLACLPGIGEILTRNCRSGMGVFLRQAVYDENLVTPEWIELSYQMFGLPGAQRSYLRAVRGVATWRGMRPKVLQELQDVLGRLTIPTLVVWGRQDRLLPVEHALEAARRFPALTLHVFEACGHLPQLEHPEAFNRIVEAFLDDKAALEATG